MNSLATKHITAETELSEIISFRPGMIFFLEHFEIYFPFLSKTVEDACNENHIRPDLFIALAWLYLGKESFDINVFSYEDMPLLITFLSNTHKYYLEDIYPEIRQSIFQIQRVNDLEGIKMLKEFYKDYFEEVKEHLDYETEVAFPYIQNLYQCLQEKKPGCHTASYSISKYKKHHSNIEEKLNDLMSLLVKYLPGKNDQQLRRNLFLRLYELDYDLKMHTKIENLILIPLVEKAEQQLQKFS